MSQNPEEKIDRLLRDWSESQRPNAKHLDKLSDRIKAAIDARVEPEAGPAPIGLWFPAAKSTWQTPLVWFLLGAAATVLVAVFLTRSVDRELPNAPQPGGSALFAQIDAGQIHNRATLFRELKEFYAGNLAWMAEVDGKVVLRVDPSRTLDDPAATKASAISTAATNTAADADRGPSVTVRLVVVSRTDKDQPWQPLWNADVIADGDQFIEVGPADGAKHRLALWAHVLPDGMVAVDTCLWLEADAAKAWNHSGVQQQAVPEHILSGEAGGTEYRVFQTVAALPEKVG